MEKSDSANPERWTDTAVEEARMVLPGIQALFGSN